MSDKYGGNTRRIVVRPEDMRHNRALRLVEQRDGDVIVTIIQDGMTIGLPDTGNSSDRSSTVEFCLSGGRSHRTLAALKLLMDAMEKDNAERPIAGQEGGDEDSE